MAPITAIALDRLLEPGASKSVDKTSHVVRPFAKSNSEAAAKGNATARSGRKPNPCLQIKPALYATPEAKPLPNSPTSCTPSPYIVNHKRRGPRLGDKEKDNVNVVSDQQTSLASKAGVGGDDENRGTAVVNSNGDDEIFETPKTSILEEKHTHTRENFEAEWERRDLRNERSSCSLMAGLQRDGTEADGFDMEVEGAYTDGEKDTETDCPGEIYTPMSDFSDAWEELSSDSAPQLSMHNVEAELCEMRLNLLMEIEKRKRAEEAIKGMQDHLEKLRQQLSVLGVTLPSNTICASQDSSTICDVNDICQQIYIARFVSNAIGRAATRAEADAIMEEQIASKNFEIARLWDRLHYYEAVNREMFQRNQDVLELARNKRQIRERKQRWVWGSIAVAFTVGSAALALSYLPTGRGSSNADSSHHTNE